MVTALAIPFSVLLVLKQLPCPWALISEGPTDLRFFFFFLVLDACFAGLTANKANTRQCLSRANPQQRLGEQCPKVLPWSREEFEEKGFLVP